MKIIYGDYFGKNIHFVCKSCNCAYEVEDREDWSIDFHICFPYKYDFPNYSTVCPNCRYKNYLGYDPDDLKGTDAEYTYCPWIPLLKERKDWNDRFRVEKKLHSYD